MGAGAVVKYADELAEGGTVPEINVGNTDISIDNFTAKDIPTVKNGEFNEFFNHYLLMNWMPYGQNPKFEMLLKHV